MEDTPRFQGLHAELTGKIIEVFYQVAGDLGFGFMKSVYRRSLVLALRAQELNAQEEVPIEVIYLGESVGLFYADIVVEGLVTLELKVAERVVPQFEAQLLHYLRASRMEVGLVLTFGESAHFKRLVLTNDRTRLLTSCP